MSKTLSGVIAAIATPIAEDSAPDLKRAVKLAGYLLDNGCDGLNVRASHEQVGELFTAAHRAREQSPLAGRPFECSVWTPFDEALRDPEHPRRREWEALGVDRLILTCLDPYDAGAVARFLR